MLRAFGGAPGGPEGATAATQTAEPEREIRSTTGVIKWTEVLGLDVGVRR